MSRFSQGLGADNTSLTDSCLAISNQASTDRCQYHFNDYNITILLVAEFFQILSIWIWNCSKMTNMGLFDCWSFSESVPSRPELFRSELRDMAPHNYISRGAWCNPHLDHTAHQYWRGTMAAHPHNLWIGPRTLQRDSLYKDRIAVRQC